MFEALKDAATGSDDRRFVVAYLEGDDAWWTAVIIDRDTRDKYTVIGHGEQFAVARGG